MTECDHTKCPGCSNWATHCPEARDPGVTQTHSLTLRCPWARKGTGWQTACHQITVPMFLPWCTVSPVHHLCPFYLESQLKIQMPVFRSRFWNSGFRSWCPGTSVLWCVMKLRDYWLTWIGLVGKACTLGSGCWLADPGQAIPHSAP